MHCRRKTKVQLTQIENVSVLQGHGITSVVISYCGYLDLLCTEWFCISNK